MRSLGPFDPKEPPEDRVIPAKAEPVCRDAEEISAGREDFLAAGHKGMRARPRQAEECELARPSARSASSR